MDLSKIYTKIYQVALEQNKKDQPLKKADLAFLLKDLGVTHDSLQVDQLIYDTYLQYGKDPAIQKAFLSNDGYKTVIDKNQVSFAINDNDFTQGAALLQSALDTSGVLLSQSQLALNSNVFKTQIQNSLNLNAVIGSSGANQTLLEAQEIFQKYGAMVQVYQNATNSVKYAVEDFIVLREHTEAIFREYALKLVDIFGDSIKVISPELFDFNTIEYINTQEMVSEVELQYTSIADSCSLLIAEISDSFKDSVNASARALKTSSNKNIGLILAAANMVGHYVDAQQKTNLQKKELLTLQNKVKKDVSTIKGDLTRLLVIYNSLQDLFIPKAIAFNDFSKVVLDKEMQDLLESIYQDKEVKTLFLKRQDLLEELKQVQSEISNSNSEISYYETSIKKTKQILADSQEEYNQAKSSKPSKPNVLFNLITLGSANKNYHRDIFQWDKQCKPVLDYYKESEITLEIDSTDLKNHVEHNALNLTKSQNLQRQIKELSLQIKHSIVVDSKTKQKIALHLTDLVKLLKVAKDIASSSLNPKVLRQVHLQEAFLMELPQDVQNSLSSFTTTLKESFALSNEDLLPASSENEPVEDSNTKTDLELQKQAMLEIEASRAAYLVNQVTQKGADLIQSYIQLAHLKAQGEVISLHYNKQLTDLENDFKQDLDNIKDKAQVLNQITQQLKNQSDPTKLKQGLLQLCNLANFSLTESDIEQVLKGNKTIEI